MHTSVSENVSKAWFHFMLMGAILLFLLTFELDKTFLRT